MKAQKYLMGASHNLFELLQNHQADNYENTKVKEK